MGTAISAADRSRWLGVLEGLGPVLRGEADENERLRRLSDKTVGALRESGVMCIASPREAGGVNLHPALQMEVFAELAQHVPQGSVDAIVTDPPYVAESLPVYREMAAFAAHALRPGGVLLTFAGHPHLPAIFDYVELGAGEALRYRWCIAYYQPAARQQVHSAKATVVWKPVLAFTRAGGHPEGYSTDWVDSGPYSPSDKARHHWGQSPAGLEALIREWVKQPEALICDPFCGGGSTLVAALRLGHRVLGADVDETNVSLTRQALAEYGQHEKAPAGGPGPGSAPHHLGREGEANE